MFALMIVLIAILTHNFNTPFKTKDKNNVLSIVLLISFISIFSYIIIMTICGSWFFNEKEYKSLIGEVKIIENDSNISPVNLKELRIVDKDLAKKRANEIINKNQSIGSQVEIKEMHIIEVNKKLIWIGALEPSGVFKWKNMDGTPGFVYVSATDYDDADIVANKNMRYTEYSYFNNNLERYLWMNGYHNIGKYEYILELDDSYNPYWIVPLYKPTISLSGNDIIGVLVVNPETGDIKSYKIDNIPSWIDRVYPEDLIVEQLEAWGALGKGWFNQSIFGAKENVIETTGDNADIIFDNNFISNWYTGLKSVGDNDIGSVGFVTVNSRNKSVKQYKISGPTEKGAKEVLSGAVANFSGYKVSNPIFANIEGFYSYYAIIKDINNNIKKYGIVSAENRSIFGISDNLQDAIREYQQKQFENNVKNDITSKNIKETINGFIARIESQNFGNNVAYYIILNNLNSNIAFKYYTTEDVEAVLTKEGDRVKFEYIKTDLNVFNITDFDNLEINIK